MIFSILESSDFSSIEKVIYIISLGAIILFSLSLHEFSHALVSYSQGDPTAGSLGRLTMNPVKHLDPIGTFALFFLGIGWAKPVPVNVRYYKNKKMGMAKTALAGPLSNAIIGMGCLIWVAMLSWGLSTGVIFGLPILKDISLPIYEIVIQIIFMAAYCNIILMVFNMLPFPPLDGSRIIFAVLPEKQYFNAMKYERIMMLVFFALVIFGAMDGFFETVMGTIVNNTVDIVYDVMDRVFYGIYAMTQ